MKMWVKWECFSVKGTDRFLVGNGVRRWELLLMAELSASKRKKSESETVKERESVRKWGGFESKLYLKTFNDEASFYLLYYYFSIGLLFHYCGFWEKTQWTGIVVSVRLWVCIWLPVKETRSEIIFLFVGFIFINFIGFFFFFPCGFLVVFGFFIGKRFGCKRLSEPEVCGAMSSGSGGGGQDTQDGDHVTVIKMAEGDTY